MKVNALLNLSTYNMLNIFMNGSQKTFDIEIKRCEKYINEKSFKKADDSISNAIHINRNSAYAWYLKAKVSIGLSNYKKALRACQRAVSIDQNNNEYIKLKENVENFINLNPKDLKIGNYPNKIDNMVIFTTNKNIKLLSKRELNSIVYKKILDDIVLDNITEISRNSDIFQKVKEFSQHFIDLDFTYDSDDNIIKGIYGFKKAKIDLNNLKTIQIAAMIHELAHHLLFEIFKNTVMYLYESQNSDTIESFAWYSLTHDTYWRLMNEYCAHAVECNYIPYKNYESFNIILENEELDEKKVKKAVELGNTLASDIIYMLDRFFTKEMVEEIKMQFLSDRVILKNKGCEFKSEVVLENDEKFGMINSVLRQNLINIKINFSYDELYQFKQIFSEVRG